MVTAPLLQAESALDQFRYQEQFVKCLLDAWALIDHTGKVVKANLLFSQLIGESSRKVLKSDSIDDLIKFEIHDHHISSSEILSYDQPTRIDEISGITKKRSDLTLIMGIYPYMDIHGHKVIGSFLLIRDVTDDKNLHDKYKTTKTDSITDNLTGLYTRRHFENYLTAQEETGKAENKVTTMSVCMVDIDHFKKVNDDYGHAAGDAILRVMGEMIASTFRKSDVTCRYGGEEFLVILPNTALLGAAVAAEKLRKVVEDRKIIFDGRTIPITISLGVAAFDFHKEKYQETVARADGALYAAKGQGRNQVQIHSGDNKIEPFVG